MFFLIRARCWVIASHYQLRQTVYPIPLSRPILSHIIVVISFSCVFQFRPCLVRPGCAARPVDSSYLRCLPRCSLTPSLWFYLFWCCCFFSVLCAVLFSLFCRVVKRVSLRWPAAGTAAARRSSGAPSSFQFQSDPAVRLYGILWVPIWRSISVPPTRKPYQFIVVFFFYFSSISKRRMFVCIFQFHSFLLHRVTMWSWCQVPSRFCCWYKGSVASERPRFIFWQTKLVNGMGKKGEGFRWKSLNRWFAPPFPDYLDDLFNTQSGRPPSLRFFLLRRATPAAHQWPRMEPI